MFLDGGNGILKRTECATGAQEDVAKESVGTGVKTDKSPGGGDHSDDPHTSSSLTQAHDVKGRAANEGLRSFHIARRRPLQSTTGANFIGMC